MTKETYQKSVDILLDAYNNGKLFHGDCGACAVGNLLGSHSWKNHFYTDGITGETHKNRYEYMLFPRLEKTINRTLYSLYSEKGYTREELEKIEYAFEMSISERYNFYKDEEPKKGQYLGLCAVLKVMAEMVEDDLPKKEIKENQEKLNTIATEKFNVLITT